MQNKHFYASARIHESVPRVAFVFATKKERDTFVKDFNAKSTNTFLTARTETADYVKSWRRFRRGIHFLQVVSGEAPKWRNMHEYRLGFYGIGCSSWPKGSPYPTFPY